MGTEGFHGAVRLFVAWLVGWFYIPVEVSPPFSPSNFSPKPHLLLLCFSSHMGWTSHGYKPAMEHEVAMRLDASSSIKIEWANLTGETGPKNRQQSQSQPPLSLLGASQIKLHSCNML